jgi:DnaJ-domain-containing protein 1
LRNKKEAQEERGQFRKLRKEPGKANEQNDAGEQRVRRALNETRKTLKRRLRRRSVRIALRLGLKKKNEIFCVTRPG